MERMEEVYRKLVYWELNWKKRMMKACTTSSLLKKVKPTCFFQKIHEANYLKCSKPRMTMFLSCHTSCLRKNIAGGGCSPDPVFFILIDNLRYDQWRILQPVLTEYFRMMEDDLYLGFYQLRHNMPVMHLRRPNAE